MTDEKTKGKEAHDRPTDETEVTPEMIAAAQRAFLSLDERWHSTEEQFAAALKAALKVLRSTQTDASPAP